MRKLTTSLVLAIALLASLTFVVMAASQQAEKAGRSWKTDEQQIVPNQRKPVEGISGYISSAKVISRPGVLALAEAMDIDPNDLVGASLGDSDERGTGMGNTALSYFPIQGTTFAVISTGHADSADLPNNEGDLSSMLDGLNNSQGTDLVQLSLQLRVPDDVNCASVDFAFYTEEHPEFVGTLYNDAFTAELGGTNLVISGTEMLAPLNFAFAPDGSIISAETVFGLSTDTETTYDGVTPWLKAQTPVDPGLNVDLVFSIQDLEDSIYDSAVFLDNFQWSSQADCPAGAFLAVPDEADLEISKTDSPDPVSLGGSLDYTLIITNHGSVTATEVVVTDILPPGVTFDSATPGEPTCVEAGSTVTCALGDLASGASATVNVAVTVDISATGSIITNIGSVTAREPDPDPDNNTAPEETEIKPTAITLASFRTRADADQVILNWETAAEIDNEGFNLWRAGSANGPYAKINPSLIPAQGNPDTGASYEYVDNDVVKGVTYYYKLEDVDIHGVSTFHGPVSATPGLLHPLYLPLILQQQ